jgi:hypothetical protein
MSVDNAAAVAVTISAISVAIASTNCNTNCLPLPCTAGGADVVSGLTEVEISGYNFGSSAADVLSVSVWAAGAERACSSVRWWHAGKVQW